MSLKVKYTDTAELSTARPEVESADGQQFGDADSLYGVGFPDVPWATLEPNGWPLDGTRRLIKSPENIGWWSRWRSNEQGVFEDPPSIRINFGWAKPVSASGITFCFWPSLGQWCNAISVDWYYVEPGDPNPDSNYECIFSSYEEPDSPNYFLNAPVDKFNFIDIHFQGTNVPGQFAKLQQLQIGRTLFIFQDEIVRVSLLNEVDPSACELTADEMTIEFRDKQNRSLDFRQDQRVELYQNERKIATQYIREITRLGETGYTLLCNSVIARLETEFLGGFYDDAPLMDLKSGADTSVLVDLLGDIPYNLTGGLEDATISGYLPVCTRREALQQIAFAIGAEITTALGVVNIQPIASDLKNPTSAFDKGAILKSTLTNNAPPAEIKVNYHQYVQSNEKEILLEGVEAVDGAVFSFSEPHWDYEIVGYPAGVAIEAHDNWIKFVVELPTTITLTGKKYVHYALCYGHDQEYAGKDNAVSVEAATLITYKNVKSVHDRLKYYYSLPNLIKGTVVVENGYAGDVVEMANPFGNDLTVGYITKMESEFTANGRTASIEVRGTDVPAAKAEVLRR